MDDPENDHHIVSPGYCVTSAGYLRPLAPFEPGHDGYDPCYIGHHTRRIYKRNKGICQLCNTPVPLDVVKLDPLYAHVDHIVPSSWGGSSLTANLQLAHRICNITKGDHWAGNHQRRWDRDGNTLPPMRWKHLGSPGEVTITETRRTKVTEADVKAIRTAWETADAKRGVRPRLAREYGVTEGAIRSIIERRTWKHVF